MTGKFEGKTNSVQCTLYVLEVTFDQKLKVFIFRGMLATEPDERLNLRQVREHDWCRKNHPCNAPPVTITPKGDDHTLSTTVLPYLVELHSSEVDVI